MSRKFIQKIDLVPEWLRHTIAAEDGGVSSPPRAHGFKVVDPFAPAGQDGSLTVRRLKAEFYEDPKSQTAVVQLAWEGTTPPVLEFYKKYGSAREAEQTFSSLLKELRQIESYVDVDPDKAKEKVAELFDEYKGQSDTVVESPAGAGSRTNSSLHLEIAPGWNVLNKQGKLQVGFTEEFLSNVLAGYKKEAGEPTQSGEYVYSTASRQHCGADNFIISYWRKVKTSDGNIVRNAALVSRINGESHFVTNVSMEDFNTLCAALTPDPVQYGIAYDSVTGKWYKTAAVVERYFSDPNHPEELDRILEYLGKGKKKMEAPKAEEKKEEKKKDKEEKSDEEKLDELLEPTSKEDESLPLTEEVTAPVEKVEEDMGAPEEELVDLLKKEAQNK